MRTKLFQILGVAAIAGMALNFNSCTTDACKDVTCENGGTCADGDCECVAGYEGVNCETLSNAKFVATNAATEDVVNGTDTFNYALNIAAGTTADVISMSPFGGFTGTVVTATISSTNSKTFTLVTSTDASNRTFNGTGSINEAGTEITINYTVGYTSGPDDTSVAKVTLPQ